MHLLAPQRSQLLVYAVSRGVWVAVEQPINSLLFKNAYMLAAISNSGLRRFTTCLGGFGFQSLKRVEIFTTIPDVTTLIKGPKDFKPNGARRVLAPRTPRGSSSSKGWKTSSWVTGSRDIKTSERYPHEFVMALARCCIDGLSQSGRSDSRLD